MPGHFLSCKKSILDEVSQLVKMFIVVAQNFAVEILVAFPLEARI